MKKKILITGASGFFGRNLVKILPKKNFFYILVLRKKLKGLNSDFFDQIIEKDIFFKKKKFWHKYLNDVHTVIHLAWSLKSNFYHSQVNKNCYQGTIELAKACKENQVKKFIGIGSCAEYFWNNKVITTTSKLRPKSNYSKYKILTFKKLSSLFLKNTKFIWLRPFFVFGDYQKKHQFFPSISIKVKKKNRIVILNSENEYDFVPIEFLCKFLVNVIKKKQLKKTYNICTGKAFSLKEFLTKIFRKDISLFEFRQTNKKIKVFGKKEKI